MREVALIALMMGIQDTADKLNTNIETLKNYVISAQNDPFFTNIRNLIYRKAKRDGNDAACHKFQLMPETLKILLDNQERIETLVKEEASDEEEEDDVLNPKANIRQHNIQSVVNVDSFFSSIEKEKETKTRTRFVDVLTKVKLVERIKRGEISVTDAADMLGVDRHTPRKWAM